MGLLEELRSLGWYLSESGLKKIQTTEKCNDVNEVIKLCLDIDFREIAEGALAACLGETLKGPIVLQLQYARNIAASKISETSSAPRMLCLELSDGQTSIRALEVEKVPSLDLNVPGTKIRFKGENIELLAGYILLRNQDIQVLGGNVSALIEKWEVARSMQFYAKNARHTSGTSGPPPWVAFGKSLDAVTENHGLGKDRNFKSLQLATEKDKDTKDNEEFNAMRSEAIAEAAKAGTRKTFGGGSQQILDYDIKKILDKGYSEEEARQFLRATNNNLERALYNLKRQQPSRPIENGSKVTINASARSTGPTRDIGPRRGQSKIAEDAPVSTKPVGNVSLFDFLTDKLPANAQKPTETREAQKPIQSKQQTLPAPSTANERETKTTTTTTTSNSYGSNQQQQQQRQISEPKTVRYTDNRQTSGRYGKPLDSTIESNRNRERSSGGPSRGGGKPIEYSNRQNTSTRGNRNSSYNESANRRAGGESERGGNRKTLINNNSNQNQNQNQNQTTEVHTNAIQASNMQHQSTSGKPRGDNQNNSRSNTNRNRNHQPNQSHQTHQQQHQQQYTNVITQKRNYAQLQRPQGGTSTSMPASSNNMNMVCAPIAHPVSTLPPQPPTPQAVNIAATTLLPNGFAYDPSKIIGFQSKEANEYAMNLMRSQGKTIGLETIVTQVQPATSQAPPIEYLQAAPPAPIPVPVPVQVPLPVPVAAIAPMRPPHHFGMTSSVPADSWIWKIGDLCMAKYWEDGQYYEAEITAIGDKTCVVYYIGYNNHEEVLKADCLPITDAHHRPINNYNLQQSMQAMPPPSAPLPQQQPMRTAMRYYVPPHKRNN